MNIIKRILTVILLSGSILYECPGQGRLAVRNVSGEQIRNADPISSLQQFNIQWNVPGPGSMQSMPIGNGDIGLNVWVEPGGDLGLFIGKTDSWDAGTKDLMKIGGMHVSILPNPMAGGAAFVQLLKLHESEIEIREGSGKDQVTIRIWVDANHPVIRIETKGERTFSLSVALNSWRKDDVILPSGKIKTGRIEWYRRNGSGSGVPELLAGNTFGAVIKGENLINGNASTLVSGAKTTEQLISVYPLTAKTETPEAWMSLLERQIQSMDAGDLEQARTAHQKWWDGFWRRSWIFAANDQAAADVTRGYVLQRYITACAGRGGYPIKFNGSVFVVDDSAQITRDKKLRPVTADFREWGGQYWYQNTRAMYWPRLQAGDFDIMMPLFKMYEAEMKANEPLVRKYYGHGGSYIAEQTTFWTPLKYVGPETPANWNDHYFTDILDIGMMMLDYYEYTGDRKFLEQTAVPMITSGLTFFNEHFQRGPDGKILLDPDNAIEMYWKARNPAPDIAGLHAVLARMILLPDNLVNKNTRAGWKKMLSELPELPSELRGGQKVLLPYEGPQTMKSKNTENPELYAIYPFRLYGVGLPDLELAIRTFNERKCKQKGCWVQDPVQAAMLGLTTVARDYVHFNFTRSDPRQKFVAFWFHGNDYQPDQDNGGNGEHGLQQMLLQSVGKKIILFPAWPRNWNVDFKLNAPLQTTIQGRLVDGKLKDLVVKPASRTKDVMNMLTESSN